MSKRRNRSGILWRMLILELWHRNFLESGKFGDLTLRGNACGPRESRADGLITAKVKQ
jgi:hypothetical protein